MNVVFTLQVLIQVGWMDDLRFYDIGWMDGWMTCDFTSFLTVFQLYQENRWVIMISFVQWNPVYD